MDQQLFCHSLTAATATDEQLNRLLDLADHVFEITDEDRANRPLEIAAIQAGNAAHNLANWKKNLGDAGSIILYASRDKAGDEPLGLFFAMARTQPEVGYELLHLWIAAVHPESRGLGIFPLLTERLKQHARDCGYGEMTVCTYPQRFVKMKRILDKNGWQEVAWPVQDKKVMMKISV